MVAKDSWIYRSGDFWLPNNLVEFLHTYVLGSETTLLYINYWHGIHFFSGVIFGLFHLFLGPFQHPFYLYFVLHTLWEAWQLWIGMTKQDRRGMLDIGMDTFFGILGLFLVIRK